MTQPLDEVPVVDNHCHPFVAMAESEDVTAWRAFFTEARGVSMAEYVASMTSYRRVVATLADFLGCEADEQVVFRLRQEFGPDKLIGELLADAKCRHLDRGPRLSATRGGHPRPAGEVRQ